MRKFLEDRLLPVACLLVGLWTAIELWPRAVSAWRGFHLDLTFWKWVFLIVIIGGLSFYIESLPHRTPQAIHNLRRLNQERKERRNRERKQNCLNSRLK